ncbi:hypothetical protein ACFU99_37375, partial [Streptomyces sp. NPDC057654]
MSNYYADDSVTDSIYRLGNAWIDFSDMLWERMSVMDAAVHGMQWTGEGNTAVQTTWNQVHDAHLQKAVDDARNIGNHINAFGDYVKNIQAQEKHAADMESIKALIETVLPMLAIFALPIMLPFDAILGALTGVLEALAGVLTEGAITAVAFAGAVAVDVAVNAAASLGLDMAAAALASAVTNTPMPDFGSSEWWKGEAISIGMGGGGALLGPMAKGLGKGRDWLKDMTHGPAASSPHINPDITHPGLSGDAPHSGTASSIGNDFTPPVVNSGGISGPGSVGAGAGKFGGTVKNPEGIAANPHTSAPGGAAVDGSGIRPNNVMSKPGGGTGTGAGGKVQGPAHVQPTPAKGTKFDGPDGRTVTAGPDGATPVTSGPHGPAGTAKPPVTEGPGSPKTSVAHPENTAPGTRSPSPVEETGPGAGHPPTGGRPPAGRAGQTHAPETGAPHNSPAQPQRNSGPTHEGAEPHSTHQTAGPGTEPGASGNAGKHAGQEGAHTGQSTKTPQAALGKEPPGPRTPEHGKGAEDRNATDHDGRSHEDRARDEDGTANSGHGSAKETATETATPDAARHGSGTQTAAGPLGKPQDAAKLAEEGGGV